jgi:hypothetical protein
LTPHDRGDGQPGGEGHGWPLAGVAAGLEEEIFADSYAALVAGPAAALGLQQLIATGRRTGLAEEDGVHPVDLLRPQILHTTLKLLAEQGRRAAAFGVQASGEGTGEQLAELLEAAAAPEVFEAGGAVIGVQEGAQLRAFVAELLAARRPCCATKRIALEWAKVPSHVPAASLEQFSSFYAAQAGQPCRNWPWTRRSRRPCVVRFPASMGCAPRRRGRRCDPDSAARVAWPAKCFRPTSGRRSFWQETGRPRRGQRHQTAGPPHAWQFLAA